MSTSSYGLSLALLSSMVNAMGDPIKKKLLNYIDPFTAVALRGCIVAPIFVIAAAIEAGGLPTVQPSFLVAIAVSGLINLIASFLYNKSLQLAPLTCSVPYLSFTPVFLHITAWLILGESPSACGFIGTFCTTVGGYLLHQHGNANSTYSMGSLYMLIVAGLYSISSAVDKVGIANSTQLTYGASIQSIVTIGSCSMARSSSFKDKKTLPVRHDTKLSDIESPTKWLYLLSATAFHGVLSYWLHLLATSYAKVSYVIALKRAGCIWTIVYGKILFGEENLSRKLVPILLMVMGVVLIVVFG
mmetsp:Transcript_33839/g.78139  ORF Transcript_33839/g.78139 Transcript_33839/m.78139 type:complete len:301 (-) Transcript_33839:904-1806(-)